MRCRLSEMHCGGWEEASFLWGNKQTKKSLPNLPNIYYSVSDHYFAALVNVRAVGATEGVSSEKQEAHKQYEIHTLELWNIKRDLDINL